MASVTRLPDFVDRLRTALIQKLKDSGITAKVDAERVPTTKLYRIHVVAPQFSKMMHTERQSLVWRIAETAVSRDELLRISMILTLEPDNGK